MSQSPKTRLIDAVASALELSGPERAAFLERLRAEAPEVSEDAARLIARAESVGSALPTPPDDGLVAPGIDPDQDPLVGHTLGEFTLIRLIDAGGMGRVYEATQRSPERRVAIKVLAQSYLRGPPFRRFVREANVLAALDHPSICRILAAGSATLGTEVVPYIAMELVSGRPLLDAAAGLDLRDRLGLLRQVCEAVDFAHRRGVVHRDLKPANILVNVEPPGPDIAAGTGADGVRVKVLDFGVAKLLGGATGELSIRTRTGQVVGTLHYMSPEQASGAPDVDVRSDVYSLGVILFELVSGRRPHKLPSTQLAAAALILETSDAPPLGSINSAWRGDLEWIAARALDRDRERRYASAAALAEDLRRFLAREPIAARPLTVLEHLRRFRRRHRTLVIGGAAAAAMLAIGLAGTLWQASAAADARRVADRARARDAAGAYASSIQNAHAALLADNPAGAQAHLAQAPAGERDWEWRYLSGIVDQADEVWDLASSGTPIRGLDVAADGLSVSVITDDAIRTVPVDAPKHAHIARIPTPATLRAAAASAASGRVALLDEPTGLLRTFEQHGGREVRGSWAGAAASAIAWTADGRSLAIGDASGRLRVHRDLAAGPVAEASAPRPIIALAWARDRVACLFTQGLLGLWDPQSSSPPAGASPSGVTDATTIAASAGGGLVVIGSRAGARLWHSDSGSSAAILQDSNAAAQCVAISSDGRLVAAGCGAFVHLWDAMTGQKLARLRGHRDQVTVLDFAPDGTTMWSGGADGTVRRWVAARRSDVQSTPVGRVPFNTIDNWYGSIDENTGTFHAVCPGQPDRTIRIDGVDPSVYRFAVSADGTKVVFIGMSPSLTNAVGDASTGKIVARAPCYPGNDNGAQMDSVHDRIAIGGDEGIVRLLSATDLSVLAELPGPNGPKGIMTTYFDSTGDRLLVGSWVGYLRILRPSDGAVLVECDLQGAIPQFAQFTCDDRWVVSLNEREPNLNMWDAQTGRLVRRVPVESPMQMTRIPGSRRVAVASVDGTIRIFSTDLAEGSPWLPLLTLRGSTKNCMVIASSDGIAAIAPGDPAVIWTVHPPSRHVAIE